MGTGMQLALDLAKAAFDIQKKSPGRFLVKQLLTLPQRRANSLEVLQNVACHVGESFEQNMVELVVSLMCRCEVSTHAATVHWQLELPSTTLPV